MSWIPRKGDATPDGEVVEVRQVMRTDRIETTVVTLRPVQVRWVAEVTVHVPFNAPPDDDESSPLSPGFEPAQEIRQRVLDTLAGEPGTVSVIATSVKCTQVGR